MDICNECKNEIVYTSAEDFQPVCYGKDDLAYHEECWEPKHGCVECGELCTCENWEE